MSFDTPISKTEALEAVGKGWKKAHRGFRDRDFLWWVSYIHPNFSIFFLEILSPFRKNEALLRRPLLYHIVGYLSVSEQISGRFSLLVALLKFI